MDRRLEDLGGRIRHGRHCGPKRSIWRPQRSDHSTHAYQGADFILRSDAGVCRQATEKPPPSSAERGGHAEAGTEGDTQTSKGNQCGSPEVT